MLTMKNIFSKRMLFFVTITTLVVTYTTTNFNLFNFITGTSYMGVKQGCYRIFSVSSRLPLLTEDLVERNCTKSLPDVIIMGAKKCGTTALKDFLNFHPQIASTTIEPQFFGKHYYFGLKWYLEQLPYTTPGQLTLDKTPKYFVHPVAPQAIQRDLGFSVKLILILRDPVKRVISDFIQVVLYHAAKELPEPTPPIPETAYYIQKRLFIESIAKMEASLTDQQREIRQWVKNLEKEYNRGIEHFERDTFEETVLLPDGTVNARLAIIDTGIYIKHMKKWLEVFPKSQFLVVDGEEFAYNPLPALQKVQNFLNVSNYFTHENLYFDKKKRFYCLAKPIQSCMGSSKGRDHPDVANDVLETLYDFYRPYNLELKKLLDLNFSWLDL